MTALRNKSIKRRPMAEINVVPYIDVMLVLLVIFMITAPLLTQGVQVNLPKAQAKAIPMKKSMPIIVSVNNQGQFFLNTMRHTDHPLKPLQLMQDIQKILQTAQSNHEKKNIFVKGDKEASYGQVMGAMVLLQKAGAKNIGLITQATTSNNKSL